MLVEDLYMHGTAITVVGLAGSLRAASYNRALLQACVELAPAGMTIEPFDLRDVPLYDRDVEDGGFPASVTALRSAIAIADALLIVTPEYNAGMPAVTKNAVDWASRRPAPTPLDGKPTLAQLEKKFICPTCQTTLELSNAPIAVRMREFIRVRLAAGDRTALAGARVPADVLPRTDRDFTAVAKPNSIALRMAMVAADEADLVATLRWGNEWDIAAAVLIGAEAGAGVSDALGAPLVFNKRVPQAFGVVVAAPGIHAAAIARLAERAAALAET